MFVTIHLNTIFRTKFRMSNSAVRLLFMPNLIIMIQALLFLSDWFTTDRPNDQNTVVDFEQENYQLFFFAPVCILHQKSTYCSLIG